MICIHDHQVFEMGFIVGKYRSCSKLKQNSSFFTFLSP